MVSGWFSDEKQPKTNDITKKEYIIFLLLEAYVIILNSIQFENHKSIQNTAYMNSKRMSIKPLNFSYFRVPAVEGFPQGYPYASKI